MGIVHSQTLLSFCLFSNQQMKLYQRIPHLAIRQVLLQATAAPGASTFPFAPACSAFQGQQQLHFLAQSKHSTSVKFALGCRFHHLPGVKEEC